MANFTNAQVENFRILVSGYFQVLSESEGESKTFAEHLDSELVWGIKNCVDADGNFIEEDAIEWVKTINDARAIFAVLSK